MKVKFFLEKDGEQFIKMIDLSKEGTQRGGKCYIEVGESAIFRLTRCHENGSPYDDGTGRESSWWSMFIGPASELRMLVEEGRGSFTRGDKRDVLPALDELGNGSEIMCFIHNRKKARDRCPGMFQGPDRQVWATWEMVESIVGRVCESNSKIPVCFV